MWRPRLGPHMLCKASPMAVRQIPVIYTHEEYLATERKSLDKHEYLCGVIYAMAGASPDHERISVNLASELRAQLKGRPCEAFGSNLKVRTDPEGLFAYPDLSVVCAELQFHDEHRDVI